PNWEFPYWNVLWPLVPFAAMPVLQGDRHAVVHNGRTKLLEEIRSPYPCALANTRTLTSACSCLSPVRFLGSNHDTAKTSLARRSSGFAVRILLGIRGKPYAGSRD